MDNVVRNVSIITGVTGKLVPIYKGMSSPILMPKFGAAHSHGDDGFGGAQEEWTGSASETNVMKEHAVNAIIKHVHEEHSKGNDVGICAIGPLSNIAIAIRMDPDIVPKIKHVYIMGGTANGWGNLTLTGEYNFVADPEAAKIVVSTFQMIHLLPWETSANFHVTEEG